MKKTIYITLSVFLGFILSFILHAIIEIIYINWAQKNNIVISMVNNCALPLWLNIFLVVFGLAFGLWFGFFAWKKIYLNKIKVKSRLLKILVGILVLINIIGFIWLINYFFAQSSIQTITNSPTPTLVPTPLTSPTTTPKSYLSPDIHETPILTTSPDTTFYNSIQIIGDDECISDTNTALDFLAANTPTHYNATLQYVGIIECVSQGSGIFVWENPPRYTVGDYTRTGTTLWYASTLPHEACHTKQYRENSH